MIHTLKMAICALLLTVTCDKVMAQEEDDSLHNYIIINPTDSPAEIALKATKVVPSDRQVNWQKLELTAFLHFGVNTFTDREWGDGKESPSIFNPTLLDARQWVSTLKKAGFKQIVLTCKHHDGFCLWPSAYTEHSVKNSPWKNGHGDVVKEVADACHEMGVGFGVYLSPWDLNSALYGSGEAYNTYFVHQLTELLTHYGQVDEVWFDGANGEGPNGKKQQYDFTRWFSLIRELQPQAVIFGMGPDVRWVGTETGYGRKTEWSVVPTNAMNFDTIAANSQKNMGFKPTGDMTGNDLGSRDKLLGSNGLVWYPAEVDVSIRPGWFYHENQDSAVKTPEKLFDIYVHSVGRNGVLLLNVPPNKSGLISKSDIASLNGFKKLRDETFKKDMALKAHVFGDSLINPEGLNDDNFETYMTVSDEDTSMVSVISLDGTKTFDMLTLQEYIPNGQRVENWSLEYNNGSQWIPFASGTTIGYKRMECFSPVTASELRLKVSGRAAPQISFLGLYKRPYELESLQAD